MCIECHTDPFVECEEPSLGSGVTLVLAVMLLSGWLLHDLCTAHAARPGRPAPLALSTVLMQE